MKFRDYLSKLLPRSIWGDVVSRVSAATTILLAVAAIVLGPAAPVTGLTWQIPLALFLVYLILSLMRTSYWLYNELQLQKDQVIGELKAENERLKDTRATLEYRFGHQPPFETHDIAYYRIGVYNLGPATAQDVTVRLLRITPSNPLPDVLLPLKMTWKDEGTARTIVPCQQQELDVLYYQVDESEREARLAVQLCTLDSRSHFKLSDGQEYRLHLEASAPNAPLCVGQFVLRAERNRAVFNPAEDGGH